MKRQGTLLIRMGEMKVFIWRFFIFVLFLCAFLLILLSKVNSPVISIVNNAVIKVSGPIMQVIEFPARIIHNVYTYVRDVSNIYADNRALRFENKQMMVLQNKVRTLEVENQLLERLLNYVPPADASFMSAKIIAESGDNFTHTLLVYIGDEAVRKGQIVLGEESVIGRIDRVSGKYAKIILVTDINSKIPVVIERTRARGILSGNNTDKPQLIFIRDTSAIQEGDVVVTSGVGGMFPSGLPIGFISSVKNGIIEIETMADISRVEYVRIVDYGLTGEDKELAEFMENNDAQ